MLHAVTIALLIQAAAPRIPAVDVRLVTDEADRWLNLNEPGVVRAFVDVLTAADWSAEESLPRLLMLLPRKTAHGGRGIARGGKRTGLAQTPKGGAKLAATHQWP